MRPLSRWPLVALPLFLLAGCWDRTELNDLSLVSAMSIDLEQDKQIETTVQIIIPQNQGTAGGGKMNRTTLRGDKGANIMDALSKLQQKLPRRIFWGQCKVFIFSQETAAAGIQEHFDFLTRHPQPRERAYIYVSKDKAADALELYPPIERSSSEVLQEISNMTGPRVTLEQMSIMLKGESQAAFLPLVYILPKTESAKAYHTIPYSKGIAVFKKGRMIGTLPDKISQGIMWIRNDIHDFTVTFKPQGTSGELSLKVSKAHVKLIPAMDGEQWTMEIRVRAQGEIYQNGTSLNPMEPDVLKRFNKEFARDIQERIELALQEVQGRMNADIVGFAPLFHRKYPKQWKQVGKKWDERFPQVRTKIVVQASIERAGLIGAPAK